ncbi:MAG: hypothetical protein K0R54_4747 [Clostridiaceae bacterium]|jgi:hypothetical protein|nr:hypothetical protein [Clostridiaceae bacterium]
MSDKENHDKSNDFEKQPIYNLAKNFSIYSITSNAMPFIVGIILLIGGIAKSFMQRN